MIDLPSVSDNKLLSTESSGQNRAQNGFLKQLIPSVMLILVAFSILFLSILRTASVRYEFGDMNKGTPQKAPETEVNYFLAFPGKVLPDSIFWPIKALRDKIWYFITTDKGKKAELLLLFADKRIASSKLLFEKNKPEEAYVTLEKSQVYLSQASDMEFANRNRGLDTNGFNLRLANASLKHYEVMQNLLSTAPDDARPKIIELQNNPKKIYEKARNALLEKGLIPPVSPFDWK